MFRCRWIPALALVFVSLLVACGGSGATTQIHESVEDFYQALVVDPPRAYTYLSEDCQLERPFLEFATATAIFGQLLGESEPEIENLRVIGSDGDEVLAQFDIVVYVDGQTVPIMRGENSNTPRFVKEGARWRFSSCDEFGLNLRNVNGSSDEPSPDDEEGESPRAEAIDAEADDDPNLAGEYVDLPVIYGGHYANRDGPHTASHIHQEIDYEGDGNTVPPAGGPHWGNGACATTPAESPQFCGPVPWGIYRTPWDAESLVHNMEHGGAIVWYNTTDRNVVDDLEALVRDRVAVGDLIVMAPFLEMENEIIAFTSWSRIDKFPAEEYDRERANRFFNNHIRRFNPEGF